MANGVTLNQSGVRSTLNSPGVQKMLKEQADKICARANGMATFHSEIGANAYGAWVTPERYSALGHVATRRIGRDGMAAINENAAHNTLKKAVGR